MYLLTYVGRMINGLTILILIWVSIFSAPRIYKDNQAKIDEAIGPIKIKIEELTSKLKGAKKEEWELKFKFYDSHPIQIDRKSEYRSTCHWKSCQSHKVTFSNIIIIMRKKYAAPWKCKTTNSIWKKRQCNLTTKMCSTLICGWKQTNTSKNLKVVITLPVKNYLLIQSMRKN